MADEEYSPLTCITAGELRDMGCDIMVNIPDCAWVPRRCVRFGEVNVTHADEAARTLDIIDIIGTIEIQTHFRWIEVNAKIEL